MARSPRGLTKLSFHGCELYESADSLPSVPSDSLGSPRSSHWSSSSLLMHKMIEDSLINEVYEFIEPLGTSKSCSVWKASHRETGDLVALKAIVLSDQYTSSPSTLNSFCQFPPPIARKASMGSTTSSQTAFHADPQLQFEFLKTLRHPHLVQWDDIMVDNRYCWISKKYISGGNLLDTVTFPLHEVNARRYINQLLVATKYLHSRNIVHRNLKACNLMLSDDDILQRDLKVVDFEFSTRVEDHVTYRDCPGNVHYVPPEIVRPRKGSELKKSDMWSIGVITYYLACGYFPFRGKTRKDVMAKIRSSMSTSLRYPPTVHLSDECKDFIESLLTFDVRQRMSAVEALRHEWIGDEEGAARVDYDDIGKIETFESQIESDVENKIGLIDECTASPVLETPHTAAVSIPSMQSIAEDTDTEFVLDRMDTGTTETPTSDIVPTSPISEPKSFLSLHTVQISGSFDLSVLEDIDGKMIDDLLEEVDQDEKESLELIEMSSTVSYAVTPMTKSRNSRNTSRTSHSLLDFEAETIDGHVIDSILDEVQQKERKFGQIDDLEAGSKVKALSEVAAKTDQAVDALTGWFAGIGDQMKKLAEAEPVPTKPILPRKESNLMQWAKSNMIDVGNATKTEYHE